MNRLKVALSVLTMFTLIAPERVLADRVNKNAVILKEVRQLKTGGGLQTVEESIYGGGISGTRIPRDSNGEVDGALLRELRIPEGTFTFAQGMTTITVMVIPMVAVHLVGGHWIPAPGRWEFQDRESNSYESVIHVKKGGDLDIVYQSTEMRIGSRDHVLHYGLSGNPHAISLSRKRLKTAFGAEDSDPGLKPVLKYQPANDIILVRIEFTPEGLLFQPIFDYRLAR